MDICAFYPFSFHIENTYTMKQPGKYILIAILLLGIGAFAAAFINKEEKNYLVEKTSQSERVWPDLLVRNASITDAPEWEPTVHKVNALSSKLITNPSDAEALIELATIYSKEARVTGEHGYYYPAILNMLEEALKQKDLTENTKFKATALQANILLAQHRWKDGLAAAKEAHAISKYNAQVFAALVDANVELGNYKEAVNYATDMNNVKPGLEAYARASYIRELHGDMPGAIEAMEKAVTAGYPGYDNTEWCRTTLAELYIKQGSWEKAEAAYRTSLEYRPNYPFAQAGIASVLQRNGEFEKAEALLLEALSGVPEIGFQEQLYELYAEWGKTEKLESTYAGIVEMVEDDKAHGHKVDLDYAIIKLRYGNDPEGALKLAENELEIRPENIHVNATLAKIYAAMGKNDAAQMYYAEATRTGWTDNELESIRQKF